HYVNSDPHPSHNYLETLNSRGLDEGNTYNYTFTDAGEIHYHCSAHLNMIAKIVVVDDSLITLETNPVEVEQENLPMAPEKINETQKEEPKNYVIDFSSIRGAHFVSSNPSHGETVSTIPSNVTLNFNFDLHSKSSVTATHNGKTVSGETKVINKLILQTPFTYDGDGVYKVVYSGCWPDGSCHNGQFGFIIDTSNK
ncbi:copper resistance protein CopC, partial [Candidatus Micrarchaeota archaeon]|nr:copper resistance protein CopC [Candidatus Micrarchaeota archaeon]